MSDILERRQEPLQNAFSSALSGHSKPAWRVMPITRTMKKLVRVVNLGSFLQCVHKFGWKDLVGRRNNKKMWLIVGCVVVTGWSHFHQKDNPVAM